MQIKTGAGPHSAFTLFELILAIALSATLLILLGTAINLYLVRTESGRTRVEQAQLARSVLAMIANDIRATAQYQTQDISSVAQLALAAKSFDVDQIDAVAKASGVTSTSNSTGGSQRGGGGGGGKGGGGGGNSGGGGGDSGGTGATSTSFGSGTVRKAGSGGTKRTAGGSSSGSSSSSSSSGSNSSSSSSSGSSTDESVTDSVPGVNGTFEEIILDVSRLPRNEELYPNGPRPADTTTANTSQGARPSDAKSVRYFVRQGTAIDPSDIAATSLSPQDQMQVGGLVRQAIDRQVRMSAEQTGNQAMLEEGQVLVAPEVVGVEFRYFDGSSSGEEWNMQELTTLPRAIEVRIWLADLSNPEAANSTTTQLLESATMYSETIELPLVDAAGTSASTSQGGSESQSGTGTSSSSSGSGTGTSGSSGTGSQR